MDGYGVYHIVYSFVEPPLLAACSTTNGKVTSRHKGHGPPSHAPAWGYRAKHLYWYYADAFVYFDVSRRVYFYLEGSNWRVVANLPARYRSRLKSYVEIEMDTDEPYKFFEEHKKLYPPGHWKKRKETGYQGNKHGNPHHPWK